MTENVIDLLEKHSSTLKFDEIERHVQLLVKGIDGKYSDSPRARAEAHKEVIESLLRLLRKVINTPSPTSQPLATKPNGSPEREVPNTPPPTNQPPLATTPNGSPEWEGYY